LSGSLASVLAVPAWLAGWNYKFLALLFQVFPHSDPRMNFEEFFIYNPLASFWIFAASCYFFWRIEDEKTAWRRSRLLEVFGTCVLGVMIALLLRSWVGAPAPARDAAFQALYPPYLRGSGSANSFPSDSTLVYFAVAAGLWPIHWKWSAFLAGWTLMFISLPRVYMGGHYPSDVASSVLLALGLLWLVRRAGRIPVVGKFLTGIARGGPWVEVLLFLWLFELAEGFRASGEIVRLVLRGAQAFG
jgi:membrane-associated phospholipid phosphatase